MTAQFDQEYVSLLLTKLLELLIVFTLVMTMHIIKQMFEAYHILQWIKLCLFHNMTSLSMAKDVTLMKQTAKRCTKKLKIRVRNNKEHYAPHYEGISGTTGLICSCGQCDLKAITNYEIHAQARPFQPTPNQPVKTIWIAKFEASEMENEVGMISLGPRLFQALHPPQLPQPIIPPNDML